MLRLLNLMMLLEKIILYITVQPWKINTNGVSIGKPFGGTAILVHKKLGNHTYRIATDTAVILDLLLLDAS